MQRIALGFLLCSLWSATSVVAQSPLCEPRFWGSTTRRSVDIMLQRGDNPTARCPNSPEGDTPLHLAAVFATDVGAVRALVADGGDMALRNAAGATPIELFMRRYEAHVVGGGAEDPTLTALETLFLSRADPATKQQWRTALDQAFASEPSGVSTNPAVGGGGGRSADPFAALNQAFTAVGAEDGEEEAGSGLADRPDDASVEDPFAALDRAFAAEAAAAAAVVDAAADSVDADASGAAASVVLVDAEISVDAAADEATEPADLAAWVRAVNAGVAAAEEAAAAAQASAAGTGSWFARTATCVAARDRLTSALARVEALTVGGSRPSYVTSAAGEEAYAELGERLESARAHGRACESIEQPR